MTEELFTIDVKPNDALRSELTKKPSKKKAASSGRSKRKHREQRERALASLVFGDGGDQKLQVSAPIVEYSDSDDAQAQDWERSDDGGDDDGDNDGDNVGDNDGDNDGYNDGDNDGEGGDVDVASGGDNESAERISSPRWNVSAPPKPAWEDDDDDVAPIEVAAGPSRLRKLRKTEEEEQLAATEYESRLREQFRVIQRGKVTWAAIEPRETQHTKRSKRADADEITADETAEDETAEEEEEAAASARLLRSAAPLDRGSHALPERELSVKRAADLNRAEASSAVVQAMQWHPNGQLALTAGFDKTLRLFRVDGIENPKVQSVHMEHLSLASAVFSADGTQILLCGPGRDWAQFDLEAGKVQMLPGVLGRDEKGFRQLLPSPDGSVLAMITETGALLLLSAKSKQIISTLQSASHRKFGCQSIAFSPDSSALYATGDSNLVNVWDVQVEQPSPRTAHALPTHSY